MKMVEKQVENITEDEAALYDRQIRLWGLDAQKRLRGSQVLMVGVCGMGAEVTKNLVLAGIKSLTLLDHRNVTPIDQCCNFLAPHDSIGKNVAEMSCERAQALNPMVQVSADIENMDNKTDEFFKDFDVICATRCSKEQLIRINNICRSNNSLFFGGDVFGMIGYTFTDLLQHRYVEEVKSKVEVEVGGEKQTVEETKMVERVEDFVPLSQALEVDWASAKYASRLKRTTPMYFIMQVLLEFQSLHGRLPDPAQRDSDIAELLTIKNALMDKLSVPREKVTNFFASCIFGQVSPVCAIVGGVLAQEIIKAVSQKDPPNKNFFFFTIEDGAGVVECIGN